MKIIFITQSVLLAITRDFLTKAIVSALETKRI